MCTDTGWCLAGNKNRTVSHTLPSSHVCRVIVGAPRANSTYSSSVQSPGAVYKCRVHSNPERRCTEMDLGRGQSPQSTASLQQDLITYIPTASLRRKDVHFRMKFTVCCYSPHKLGFSCSFPCPLCINSPKHLFCFIRIMQPYTTLNSAAVVLLILNLLIWRHVRDKGVLCARSHKYFDKYKICFC